MTRRGGEDEALREVVREARSEPVVEPDWERLEKHLLQRVAATQSSRVNGGRSPFHVVGLALAASLAAVVVFAGARLWHSNSGEAQLPLAASRSFGPEVSGALDGDTLRAGDAVLSGARSISVDHRGQASWVLEPSSHATVVSQGNVIALRLDSGALSAQVVPVHRPESFIVEAGGTRVAVHGTRFRVERRDDRVLVGVTEGVVTVSSLSRGPKQAWTLRGPSHGDFALDGASGEVVSGELAAVSAASGSHATRAAKRLVNPNKAVEKATQSVEEEPAVEAPETLPEARAELPAKPSIGDVESGLATVVNIVTSCFAENMPARGDIRVTARTTLKLQIAPDGRVASEEFDPPLAPSVRDCATQGSKAAHFAPSHEGVSVTRTLELAR